MERNYTKVWDEDSHIWVIGYQTTDGFWQPITRERAESMMDIIDQIPELEMKDGRI